MRTITLVVEQLEGGRLRFTQPGAPGWVAVGRTPVELVRVLRGAFTERQVAAHSSWRGNVYDHPAAPQVRRPKPRSRGKRRADCYEATEWLLDDRGRWVSPKGLHYPDGCQVVERVKRRRVALGMSPYPSAGDSREQLERITGTQLAMRLVEEST